MPQLATELPLSTSFQPIRLGKVLFGTYLGLLVFRNRLGRLFNVAMEPIVNNYVPVTTDVILATPIVGDESVFVAPAGTIAAMTFTLPAAVDSRVGMIRRLQSTQIITALTVNAAASGVIAGLALTAAAVNTPYAWQCRSITGSVATWHRIQ